MSDTGPILARQAQSDARIELLTIERNHYRAALEKIVALRLDQCFGAVDWAIERGRIARDALEGRRSL